MENSSVEARENSSVEGNGNSQIVDRLYKKTSGRILVSGNSRVVYNPKTIMEYINFYGIKHDKKKCTLYKAVRKIDGELCADRDNSFKYIIGEKSKVENMDMNVSEDCGEGIHLAHLNWCLNYGKNWDDLAIIECEVKICDIVCPESGVGKVRASEVLVVREIPLEECGLYGKMLAKRR